MMSKLPPKGGALCSRLILSVTILAVLAMPASAPAAFPGQNGKIAYWKASAGSTPDGIWTVNPDGSQNTEIAQFLRWPRFSPDGTKIAVADPDVGVMNQDGTGHTTVAQGIGLSSDPAWSPDQTRIAYESVGPFEPETYWRIVIVNVSDGQSTILVTEIDDGDSDEVRKPAWSPAGDRIAFSRNGNIWTIRPDGTDLSQITTDNRYEYGVDWSPDASRLVFGRDGDIYTIKLDGTNLSRLTEDPAFDADPAWSPNGSKIVFHSNRSPEGLYTMNFDGTSETLLVAAGGAPDWQPIPFTGYARPKGATPLRVSLVPAYNRCETPNRTHGPPLAFGSCDSPEQASSFITAGTPDANGFPSNMTGFLRLDAMLGNPSTPADEADIGIRLHVTDVRYKGDPSLDYPYRLFAPLSMQLTDKDNGCCAFPATMRDGVSLYTEAPCTTTADPNVGSTCDVTTTADAFIPGMVRESQREVWQMRGPVQVFDFGPDASGAEATLFLTQGVFVP